MLKKCRTFSHGVLNVIVHVNQYTYSLMSRCVFSIPMWWLCSCSRICFSNRQGIFMHLPFIAVPSIIASSYPINQYFSTLSSTASLVDGCPLINYLCSICNSGSCSTADHMSFIEVPIGMSTNVLMFCILTFVPGISWSLFSMWLWHNSQSAMYSLGLGLYKICMMYWCICSMMQCGHSDNIITSLLILATSCLWSGMTHTSFAKQ